MNYELNSEPLRNKFFEKVFQVYEIFQNFFGEEYVDLQGLLDDAGIIAALNEVSDSQTITDSQIESAINNLEGLNVESLPFILVYWPEVTVSNEHDRSVKIQKLFAKVSLTYSGKIPYGAHGFLLNRSKYPISQYVSNYMHSHIRSIPKGNPSEFKSPCLGSGPIRETILSLKNEYDELKWLLFCQELSVYVTVESITGRPYKYLEGIGKAASEPMTDHFDLDFFPDLPYSASLRSFINDFIPFYLTGNPKLKIGFSEDHFVPDISFYDFMVDISNAFIKYFNAVEPSREVLYEVYNSVLAQCLVKDRKFYPKAGIGSMDNTGFGSIVCMFKGEPQRLELVDDSIIEGNISHIMFYGLANTIMRNIINTLNIRFIDTHGEDYRKPSALLGQKTRVI